MPARGPWIVQTLPSTLHRRRNSACLLAHEAPATGPHVACEAARGLLEHTHALLLHRSTAEAELGLPGQPPAADRRRIPTIEAASRKPQAAEARPLHGKVVTTDLLECKSTWKRFERPGVSVVKE